jgi:hypothetical protein
VAHGQAVVVCGSEGSAGLLEGLPSPLEEREEPARSMQPARGGAGGDEELRIAWRYKQSLQRAPALRRAGDDFVHRFDLSRPLQPLAPGAAPGDAAPPGASEGCARVLAFAPRDGESLGTVTRLDFPSAPAGGLAAFSREVAAEARRCAQEGRVLRVVLPSLGASHSLCGGEGEGAKRQLLGLLLALKGLVRRLPVVLVFSLPGWLAHSADGARLLRVADSVVRLDSVESASPHVRAQFKDYTAFLQLVKPLRLAGLTYFAPKDAVNLLVRIRRKVPSSPATRAAMLAAA